jgi:hypothetical protein
LLLEICCVSSSPSLVAMILLMCTSWMNDVVYDFVEHSFYFPLFNQLSKQLSSINELYIFLLHFV